MEEQGGQEANSSPSHGSERSSEPVRSRWTPKPEQILILESIFNSGMVNPPKDETVRIRKLLEKFGSVGDANVFYWFQNRRSRSRRRQRQLQASLAGGGGDNNHHHHQQQQHHQQAQVFGGGGAIQYENCGHVAALGGYANSANCFANSNYNSSSSSLLLGNGSSSSSSSSCGGGGGGGVYGDEGIETLLSMSGQMGFHEIGQSSNVTSVLCPSDTSNLHYQSGFITVFINGVATEVPRGALDMKAMFGQDVMLVHSSGVPMPMNDFGFLLQSLQPGESYFLVSRQT